MKTVIFRILRNKYDYDKVLSRRCGYVNFFFFLAAQNRMTPTKKESQSQIKAIEKWMEKRQDRR